LLNSLGQYPRDFTRFLNSLLPRQRDFTTSCWNNCS
jgi:hypothetical protein